MPSPGRFARPELVDEEGEQNAPCAAGRCCGVVKIRVTCAPRLTAACPTARGRRTYLSGIGRVQGIFEEEFRTSIGHPTNLTLWNFQLAGACPRRHPFWPVARDARLVPLPLHHDRVIVTGRVHQRQGLAARQRSEAHQG